ncbi:hypothetical protein Nepgr_018413 [Nepenthes gracilis]|uniref:Uncharacterized protein n=1 Tax=Nepenthes gracilis TaxID=150966 RepID=A0AAD3XT22_NEPGR|nr:hypothetical protein Nepgr_018413 [Nepenthes gracilis]
MGNGRCEWSRKNKKSEPEEPKERRRGLGVAELERLLRESNGYGHHLPSPHVPFSNTHNQLVHFLPFPPFLCLIWNQILIFFIKKMATLLQYD